MKLVFIFVSFTFLVSCQNKPDPKGETKDFNFYSGLVNTQTEYNKTQVSANLEKYKMLYTKEAKYSIRLLLFNDGVFYYQVDQLGDGEGHWEYREGGLKLIAPRPIFDMQFDILADKSNSQGYLIQFFDRFGFNTMNLNVMSPSTQQLKPFSKSPKNL